MIPGLNQTPPILIEPGKCRSVDATEFFHVDIDGENLSGTACFMASEANNGEMLVPYANGFSPGTVLMGERFSANVRRYTQNYVSDIKFLPTQIDEFKAMRRSARWERVWDAFIAGAAGVAIIFVLTFAIGWIARGFIGKRIG